MASARWRRLALSLALLLFAGPASAGGIVAAERIADYDRLSIDWRQVVDYRVRRSRDRVTVDFATSAPLNTHKVDARAHRNVRALRAEGSRLILHLETTTRVRHYRNGPRFVIDLLPSPVGRGTRPERIKFDPNRPVTRSPVPATRGVYHWDGWDGGAGGLEQT